MEYFFSIVIIFIKFLFVHAYLFIVLTVFKDENTQSPFQESFTMFGDDGYAAQPAMTDQIYIDCLAIGMACSCIQVTMQCSDLEETKYLYDQLVPLCPIMVSTL